MTIPLEVTTDSAYPFQVGERVLITIEGEQLIVKKTNGDE